MISVFFSYELTEMCTDVFSSFIKRNEHHIAYIESATNLIARTYRRLRAILLDARRVNIEVTSKRLSIADAYFLVLCAVT